MTWSHLDEGLVQQLLHDEAPAAIAQIARTHLDACAECRERMAEARRVESELFAGFAALDDATAPARTWETIVDRQAKRARHDSRAWRWAAGLLLVAAASGVVYAAPGSPLRWVATLVRAWVRTPAPALRSDSVTSVVPDPRGVMLDPGRPVLIDFPNLHLSDTLRVRLVDAAQVAVEVLGDSVKFASDPDHLTVTSGAGIVTIDVRIPRSAPRVEIVSRGRELYLKDGNTVRSMAADSTGGVHLVLPARR